MSGPYPDPDVDRFRIANALEALVEIGREIADTLAARPSDPRVLSVPEGSVQIIPRERPHS